MAKDVKKKFTISLDISTEDAEKQVKAAAGNIQKMLARVGNAADKMTVFKDVVEYIGQIDQALDALQSKGKTFSNMFDGMDADLKKVLEQIFGVSGKHMADLEDLKAKVAAVKAKPDATTDDLKPLEQQVKSLYAALNMADKAGISGKGKIETRIAKLEASLINFGVVFEGVKNKIKDGFNFGEQDDMLPYLKDQNTQIQQEIQRLEKSAKSYKTALAIFSGKGSKFKITTTEDNDVKTLETLQQQYADATDAVKQFEAAGETSSDKYKRAVAQAVRSATFLKNTMDHVVDSDDSSVGGQQFVSKAVKNGLYEQVETYLEDIKQKDIFGQVETYLQQKVNSINQQIEKLKLGTNYTGGANADDTTAAQNQKEADSYDQLSKKVAGYIKVKNKLSTLAKGTSEYKDLYQQTQSLSSEILSIKDLSEDQEGAAYAIFDKIDDGSLEASDAIKEFCNLFKIDIPNSASQASSAATSSFAKITKEANKAASASQNVMYHLGNLLNGKGKARDTFGDMAENLTTAVDGTPNEKYGFGVLGGGLFGVTNPSAITQEPIKSTFIQSIDLSKYNMYMADTEERATALMDFLSKLQKFSMKSAAPNYTGFDAYLQGIDADSLYDQFKVVFEQSDLTKEQFKEFINEMVALLKQAGLEFDAQTGELGFKNISKELANSGNISTRFMKKLGFEGVNVGATSLDSFEQGSVLFDFKEEDIVGYFESISSAVQDYEKIVKQANDGDAWVGTTEQLQKYASNIDVLIDRLQNYKSSNPSKNTSGLNALNETLNKLTQIRENINNILSGNGIGDGGSFETITTGVKSADDEVKDVTGSFQDLVNYVSKSGQSPKAFFQSLESGAMALDGELKNILKSLNLIDDAGNIKFSATHSGSNNAGGMISDQYALIARPIGPNGEKLKFAQQTQPKLFDAEKMGASVGTILHVFEDTTNGMIYELQKTVKGTTLVDQQHKINNTEFLNATDAQIKKMLQDFVTLQKNNLWVDQNGKNILYDKDQGFSFIDLFSASVPGITASAANSLQENVNMFISSIFNSNPSLNATEVEKNFKNKVQNMMQQVLSEMSSGTTSSTNAMGTVSSGADSAAADVDKVVKAFQELSHYIATSTSGPKDFFNKISSGAIKAEGDLKDILTTLNMIDENGNINFNVAKGGLSNKGTIISDDYVLISRDTGINDEKLGFSKDIMPRTAAAKKAGANIGEILGVYQDEINKGVFYELQSVVSGKSILAHGGGKINTDFLNATDEQIKKLIADLKILKDNDLWVDWNGNNILYDKDNGFSLIDFFAASVPGLTVGKNNSVKENLDMFFKMAMSQSGGSVLKNSSFMQHVYDLADQVENEAQNIPANQESNAQAIQQEATAHANNTAAINAENAALQANIELKKKARSMKWGEFATDETLSGLKQTAGVTSLADLHQFWKQSNYDKRIDFHELKDDQEANDIIERNLGKQGMQWAKNWYSTTQDFTKKTLVEDMVLADDELRNAALNHLWHISGFDKKMPYLDFLNTPIDMFRNDAGPIIFGPDQKLSFTVGAPNYFDGKTEKTTIKPIQTMGKVTNLFNSEKETFVPSHLLPVGDDSLYIKNSAPSFDEYYKNLNDKQKKMLDKQLFELEKQRTYDLLQSSIGDDALFDLNKSIAGSQSNGFNAVLDQFRQGIVPDTLQSSSSSSNVDKFADAYNTMSDVQKRLVAFYATLQEYDPYSSVSSNISELSKTGFTNVLMHDNAGVQKHKDMLTGESKFNIYGSTTQDIQQNTQAAQQSAQAHQQSAQAVQQEAEAHRQNTQAMQQSTQAQQNLSDLKQKYADVQDKLWDAAFSADGDKGAALSSLWSQIHDVGHTDQSEIANGNYYKKSTGELARPTEIFALAESIEQQYGEDLGYVKDYLKQVYANMDFDAASNLPKADEVVDFKDIKQKLYDAGKDAWNAGDPGKYHDMLVIMNHLMDVNDADDEAISQGVYYEDGDDSGRALKASDLLAMVEDIESRYNENLDFVKNYLQRVYGDIQSPDAVINDTTSNKYAVADYENAYIAESAESQAAIDDLALITQRYEELYALTQTKPIDITLTGVPTPDEINEVLSTFNEFKAKQKEIYDLTMTDADANQSKIQELQAEVIGLQNKLRGAALGDGADAGSYEALYGLSAQDAMRMKNLVDDPYDLYHVIEDLQNLGEQKMNAVSQTMQDMLNNDEDDTATQFLLQHAQKLKDQAAVSTAASEQQLQNEQAITAEKQKQNALDNQQDAQPEAGVDAVQKQPQVEQDITAEKQKQAVMDDQQAVADTPQVQAETVAMNELLLTINAVEQAVKAKTAAFEAEGVAVEGAVNKEISALTQLKTLLDDIQNALQVVFAANGNNLGNINLEHDNIKNNTMSNVLQGIQQTLGQILGVLQGFTGVEADNKNSVKYKEPIVDNTGVDSDAYKVLAAKIPEDIATETTLSAIKGAVEQIAKSPEKDSNIDLTQLTTSLMAAVVELKSVANGIVQHQKAAKSDTSVANARIADKDSYAQIRDVALNSLGNKALESEVTEMKALADGIVQVTGWLKVAEDAWEGFTVQINESNEASKLAFSTNSKAAKQAAAQAQNLKASTGDETDDANIKLYDRAETEARAHSKIAQYTSEGKIATVQFKDSGRYTITILEKIGGLTKQIFQTFDENDAMIERTTATMSNTALTKVQELQKIAQFGLDNDLINGDNKLYQDFQKASSELEAMNVMYSQTGNLADDQIANWTVQIDLVTQLGKQIQKLVAQNKNSVLGEKFTSKKQKQSAAFNTDYAKLQQQIAIPDSFTQRITDVGNAIKNAVNNDELQIAQNNWATLRKEIELTAMQQDLYIGKSSTVKGYGATPLVNAQADFNRLSSRARPYIDDGWTDVADALDKYEKSLQKLRQLQNTLANQPSVSEEEKTRFVELKKACSDYGKELKKLVDNADKFSAGTADGKVRDIMDDINVNDRSSRGKALKSYVQETYGAKAVIKQFNDDMTELQFTIKNTDGTTTKMTAAFNSAKTQIGSLRGETKEATTVFGSLVGKFKELGTYAMARLGVDEIIQAIRTGVNYVIEIDTALTELKKVTDETDASYNRFLQNMSKTAGSVGSTVSELTTMAAEWARLGYSMEESGQLAKSTAILLNVSEFSDATTASEALISTMQAFGYAADESQRVVDILNEVKVTCLLA